MALWVAIAVLAFAAPAQAIVVQYTGTLTSGFGDGGFAGSPPGCTIPSPTVCTIPPDPGGLDTANNAFPACNPVAPTPLMSTTKGLGGWIATEGSAMFVGAADVTTGMAPQAVRFLTQGGANGLSTNCTIGIPNIQPQLTMRTQTTNLVWPAYSGSFMAGGGFAPFTFSAPATFTMQTVMAVPGGSTFGGALRVNGLINAKLVARTPYGGPNRLVGSLPARLSVGAQGGPATPTYFFATTQPFALRTGGGGTVPSFAIGAISEAFFPWTTGQVIASDSTGQFFTFRSRVGFDARTPMGLSGTLQLVTPAVVLISGIGAPLPFMPTSVLTLQFTPEPGATALLGAGVLTLLGLCAVQRRRR